MSHINEGAGPTSTKWSPDADHHTMYCIACETMQIKHLFLLFLANYCMRRMLKITSHTDR